MIWLEKWKSSKGVKKVGMANQTLLVREDKTEMSRCLQHPKDVVLQDAKLAAVI